MAFDLTTQLVHPLEKLPDEGERAIHEASIDLLESDGIKVDHQGGLDLLADHGLEVDRESRLVRIPGDLAESCMDSAPASFTLHGRNPDTTVTVGEGDPVCSPCASAPNIIRHGEERRPSRMADYEDLVKLAQAEDVITVTGYNLCEPNDVDQEIKHYEEMKRSVLYSDMPLLGSSWGADRSRVSMEIAGLVNDDPDLTEPYIATTINSVSPRVWDSKMTDGLLAYASEGQPVIISPAVMAAASGPATLAGALALANAEILAGVTMTQLENEGAPVVYGLPSSNVDVRYGSFSIGSPEGALCITFAGQMARYYDVPSRAGGCITDSKTVDDQSGAESMFQLMTTVASGIDFIHHSAGILDSYSTCSPEKFVLDCDRHRYMDRFRRGFDINEETLARDLIGEVEPAGHFLNKRHTLEHSKTEFLIPELYDRRSYDTWAEAGENRALERAHERVETLLEEYEPPPLDDDIRRDLETYVDEGIEQVRGDS